MSHIVIGTAGHIDHGKTSLVQALTGQNTDRLKEEKKRGITIELGFAGWKLSEDVQASIVDVPGHERLVRTMVAGAGGLDLAMLVIAADDGVMPQTKEHLDILKLLQVQQGITVITKSDLVDEELLELVQEDIRETIEDTPFSEHPIVTVSSKTRDGLDTLRDTVIELVSKIDRRVTEGPAFLPLDRVFTKEGFGTVATGTTLRGTLQEGDSVELLGSDPYPITELKVRGLQALGKTQENVTAGMRTAVNISGKRTDEIKRGMILTSSGAFENISSCIVWVELLHHATPLKNEVLSIHLGTCEREATVIPLGCDEISPGESGGLLLRLKTPVACFAGQRFVLRRPGLSVQATVGGGEILDPHPAQGKGSVALATSQLEQLRGNRRERIIALAKESRSKGLARNELIRRVPAGEIGKEVDVLTKKGKLVQITGGQDRWISTELADSLVRKVVAMVETHHKADAMSPGMIEAEIETQLPPPEQHLAQTIVDRAISQKKLFRQESIVAIPGMGAAVDPESKVLMDKIMVLLEKTPLTPPNESEILSELRIDQKQGRQLLGYLRRNEEIVKATPEIHYSSAELAKIEEKVIAGFQSQTEMTASELKDVLGAISRKWAIPLFELLDKRQVTVRRGNVRLLHPSRAT